MAIRPAQPVRVTPSSRTGVPAPSGKLPLAFMLTGLAALFTGSVWIVWRPAMLATYHYNQYVIALTHLFVLGWICSVVMGAVYQLVPVALETRLYSERLARWQFAFHLIGFTGMVWMFKVWNLKQVGHFGSVFAAGVVLFVFNLAQTLRRVPRWNVTATAVTAALCWLLLTVLAGLLIATGKSVAELAGASGAAPGRIFSLLQGAARLVAHFDAISAMHAHAHLGGIGCFTMLIVGVSYRLIPMFTLSEVQSRRRAGLSVALLNLGLAGSFVTILLRSAWKFPFALVTIVALMIYGWELMAILRARKRRLLDWGVTYFLTALALLAPVSAVALVLSAPGKTPTPLLGQLENLYGFLGLLGVVTLAIIGMLYKIIPFLVWFWVYSKHLGRAQVPALAGMYSSRWQGLGYWSFLAALVVIGLGIMLASERTVRCGALLFVFSVGSLLVNMGKILAHALRPRLTPLATEPLKLP